MVTNHNPIDDLAAALPPDDRLLLELLFHDSAPTLADVAAHLGTDLLALTQRILSEPFQAALAAIEQAAAAVARARALVSGSTAVSALTAAATSDNPSFAERRRAGAALLRFAPPTPARASEPHSAAAPTPTSITTETPAPSDHPESASVDPPPPIRDPQPETRDPSTRSPTSIPISSTVEQQPPARHHARDRPNSTAA